MDELLQKVAEMRGMPASLVQRSAQARAEQTGSTVEAVLAEWAGAEAVESENVDAEAPLVANSDESDSGADDQTPEADTESQDVTVDSLVKLAATAKRMPPKLILSSAQARATNSSTSVEQVLATWAGVDLDELRANANTSAEPSEDAAPEPEAQKPAPKAAPPAAAVAAVAATAMTTDELLDKVAEVRGMPASLVKRSAQARSNETGEPLEAVLAEWAGVEAGTSEVSPEPDAEQAAAVAPVAAVAAAAMTTDELLDKVAEVRGMPASLVKRSAQARSNETGEPLEAVLAEWAGVEVGTVSAAGSDDPADAATAQPPPDQAAETDLEELATNDTDVVDGSEVEVIEAIEPDQAAEDGADTAAPKGGRYPVWLAALFVLIPLLAVAYIVVSPNGPDCGTAGQLGVDPATGEAVNCDGTAYGSSSVDYFGSGSATFTQCAACHGSDGGGGAGPAMAGGAILATFPSGSCSDHIEWVSLGSAGYPESTYGATGKAVGSGGVMPGYAASLSEEQIASVVLYERVQFGGQTLEDALVDCGLGEDEAATIEAAAP